MSKKRVMILGASYSQIPLYQAAKKMGIHTIAASIPGPYEGFAYADEICFVNIADSDAVVQKAKEYNIDGIVTCSLDLGMAAIGVVCETLNLCGPSKSAAIKASNKREMKEAFIKAGVQTANYHVIYTERELEQALQKLSFPVIIKAVDLMGSRGIFRCNTVDEARINYKKTMSVTRKQYCLVEEFIEGEIFGVEAMIQNGKIIYQLPNNIEVFYGDTPTPLGHSVPYRYVSTFERKIQEQVEKAIRGIGLNDCPVNCDMIRKEDKVYMIELSGRSGATGLSEMVSSYYNINYYEMILRVALGMPVEKYFIDRKRNISCLTHTIKSDKKGILRNIKNLNEQSEDIVEISFNVKPGDEIHVYQNGRDRIGQVIIKGDDLKSCEKRLKEILSKISLELK